MDQLVTGAMGSLAPKLLQLLQREYKLHKDVRKEVKSMSDELECIHAALRKVAEVPWYQLDEQDKIWANQVREASYDIEDILDTVLVRVKGHDLANPNRLKRGMNKMSNMFTNGKAHHDIARAIESVREQLQVVADRRYRYNFGDRPEAATTSDPRLSALYTRASKLVGIDEPRDKLIEMLAVGKGDKAVEMKIVSIVGFGGLGKTTLAKAVYDKLVTINPPFDCCAFVPVGQNPDHKKVLRDILIGLQEMNMIGTLDKKRHSVGDLKELDERQLIDELRGYLNGKRYFIVIDDVWETSTWKIVNLAFVDGNCGSRILTTTRNSQVSTEIGEVYQMEQLSDSNSKKLFYTITFGGEEKRPSNDELDEVSATIMEKCRGVPIAIITIAGVLARKPPEQWPNLYNSIGFGHDDKVEDMKKILSSYLRTCFLYLCIFPEEYPIENNNLILRWIAEGFIHEERAEDCFKVGDTYLHELIDRNMIIPVLDKRSGLLRGCCIHDMLLRLIRQFSSMEENFVIALDRDQRSSVTEDKVHRLALAMLEIETSYKDMARVRSFNCIICSTKLIPLLCSFKFLRVLVLEFCIHMDGYDLEHIAKLLHLRYIGLSHTHVHNLPKEIGRLKFLQTLLLDDTGIEELPASVCLLNQLMCLNVDEKTRVPDWIGKMMSLVELEMYHDVDPDCVIREKPRVQKQQKHRGADNQCSARLFVKELGNLKNLRVLKTGITLQYQKQGRDFLVSLSNLHNIQHISVLLTSFLEIEVVTEPSLPLSSSLRTLELLNLQFEKLPPWMNGQYLPNLCQLKVLVSNEDEQELGNLGTLKELRDLGLITIKVHRVKLTVCGCGGFQNLRFLRLTAPLRFLPGALPRLEDIDFNVSVMELKDANISSNLGLENLSSLQSVTAKIDCADADQTEVEEVEAAIRHEVEINPNNPALSLKRDNEDKMGPAEADSRLFSRLMYKTWLDKKIEKLNEQVDVQNKHNNELFVQARKMADSIPEGHPTIAKMKLQRQRADTRIYNQLMQQIKVQEQLLELYNDENQRMAAIMEELKAAVRQDT